MMKSSETENINKAGRQETKAARIDIWHLHRIMTVASKDASSHMVLLPT